MWGSKPSDLTQSTNNPPKILKEALLNITGVANVVTNYALHGTTLYDMMRGTDGSGKTYVQRLNGSPCDIVYCNHGINDNQTGKDILNYRKDLINFVKISRSNNAVPVLVTPNPNAPIFTGTATNSRRLPLFVKVMRSVANDMTVDLVDQQEFFENSSNAISPSVSFPDVVHLSEDAYRQAGYNLAIPLVACHSLLREGDNAGLDGAQFFRNSTKLSVVNHGARCGATVSWIRESIQTGLNYPVILKKGEDVIAANMLQWADATKGFIYVNNANKRGIYPQKRYGGSSIDWDSEVKVRGPFYAGLNVIGILTDLSSTYLGTGLTFSGLFLPQAFTHSISTDISNPITKTVIESCDQCFFSYLPNDSGKVVFNDKFGVKVASITLVSGRLRLSLYYSGTEIAGTDLASSGILPGTFAFRVSPFETGLYAKVGDVEGAVTSVTNIPNIILGTKLINYVVTKN